MGSIFKAQRQYPNRFSNRQVNYLDSRKKPGGKRNEKTEENMQIELCDWLREVLPGVHFRSDTASGAFNSRFAKNTHNRQQSADGLPDLTIFAPRRGYHALMLELKAEGVNLKKKRDGTKIIVRKDSKGRIIERDYKIRLKGDWSNLHIEKQAKHIEELREAGYCAVFAVGIEQAKKIVSWYFDLKYTENAQMF